MVRGYYKLAAGSNMLLTLGMGYEVAELFPEKMAISRRGFLKCGAYSAKPIGKQLRVLQLRCRTMAARQYGWGRIDAGLGDVNGLPRVTIAPALYAEVKALRIYDRALSTSEAVGNFRAGY